MKRKIALLLAVVMILSLVPMMSFAASDNRVNKVPTVADDHEFDNATTAPILRIEEKDTDWGTAKQTFRLRLENAEWLDSIETVTGTTYGFQLTSLSIEKLDDVTVEVEVVATSGAKSRVEVPMLTEMTGKGEATVTVIPRDSALTGGTYTFAKTTDGKAIVTVRDSVTFGSGTKVIKTIEIDETNIGAFEGRKTVRLRLPADFEWVVTDSSPSAFETAHVNFRGGYASDSVYAVDASEDVLEITFDLTKTTTVRGSIFLEGLAIKATRDARFGDVVVVASKDVDSADLLVAKYVDYGVTIEAAGDARELVAGKFKASATEDEHKLQKLVIKEDITGSWLPRATTIEFPSWVKVRDVKVNKADKLTNISTSSTLASAVFSVNKNQNIIEFTPAITSGEKANLELTFYVSVEADATGDITATVSSRGLDEDYEVVLGKAVAPVIVETNPTNVKVGVQNQEIGKITLTEIAAGSFIRGEEVVIALEDDFRWKNEPKVEVVEGDLRIDRVKTNKEFLTFEVTRESSKPAVIEITGGSVDLYRHLPEGEFKVYVGGEAIVQNFEDYVTPASNEKYAFKTKWAAKPVVANIITPAPGEVVRESVSLTIGQIPAGADAAPYVKNNRTYAPVSAVAQSLGVAKSNIIWNAEARTVTILGEKTVQMTIGSTTLLVNGVPVVMDVAPEITSSRTFLPIAWLAKALDVEYSWDAATQTVTFY